MSKMKAPLPAPVRHVFGPLVGWLTRNANRRFHGNDGWYLVKDMVLRRMAFPDGADMQILPPKKCWDCTDGVLYKLTAPQRNIFCSKCDGTGNYVPERLV